MIVHALQVTENRKLERRHWKIVEAVPEFIPGLPLEHEDDNNTSQKMSSTTYSSI